MGRKTAGQSAKRHTAQRARLSPSSTPKPTVGRPRKLKPAPPVSDCVKCQKLAALTRENRKLREEIDARNKAALAGVPVTLDAEAVLAKIERAQSLMAAALEPIAERQVRIATSHESTDADATRSGAWVFDRVAGPVTQKVKIGADEGAVIQFVSGLPTREPAPVLPTDGSGDTGH